ncbi:MAG: hypothetical protein ACYDBA_07440 [Sulfuricaulis sp.]
MKIAYAETQADIARCFPVMAELRAHLSATEFTARVKNQHTTPGYHRASLCVEIHTNRRRYIR